VRVSAKAPSASAAEPAAAAPSKLPRVRRQWGPPQPACVPCQQPEARWRAEPPEPWRGAKAKGARTSYAPAPPHRAESRSAADDLPTEEEIRCSLQRLDAKLRQLRC
jgi:hypothetical protein